MATGSFQINKNKKSPFEKRGEAGYLGKASDFLFGTKYNERAKRAFKDQQRVKESIKEFEALPTDNIYAGFQNLAGGVGNVYSDMENVFEDATVDQRAAQFQAQQASQQQANILDAIQSGGSFSAGNIQALANQAQTGAQQAAASIGQQERQNQMMAMQESSRLQSLERQGAQQAMMARLAGAQQAQQMQFQGAADARNLEFQKVQGIMAARAGQAAASEQARAQGVQATTDFFGNVIDAVLPG